MLWRLRRRLQHSWIRLPLRSGRCDKRCVLGVCTSMQEPSEIGDICAELASLCGHATSAVPHVRSHGLLMGGFGAPSSTAQLLWQLSH